MDTKRVALRTYLALAAKRKKEAEEELEDEEDEEKERVFPLFPRANGETDR